MDSRRMGLVFSVLTTTMMMMCGTRVMGVSQQTLETVCSQTQNQEMCEKILESDPRTASADLRELALISIRLAIKQGTTNLNTIARLAGDSTRKPELRGALRNCVGVYETVLGKVNLALRLSEKKEYDKISQLGEALTFIYECENQLPVDSPTGDIGRDMILTVESAAGVNQYIVARGGV